MYKLWGPLGVKISVIARGIPVGDELEYTDALTLGRSVNRVCLTKSTSRIGIFLFWEYTHQQNNFDTFAIQLQEWEHTF